MTETTLKRDPSALEKLASQIHAAIDLLGDDARWIGRGNGSLLIWSKKQRLELTIESPTEKFST